MQYTPLEDIPKVCQQSLRDGFRSGKTKAVAFRKEQLKQMGYMVQENKDAFLETLKSDLGRPYLESEVFELIPAINDIRTIHDNLHKWAKTESAPFQFAAASMHPKIRKEPKGTVLIIVPFNAPVFLGLTPLMAAVAAGNTAVIKPSENAPATNTLLAKLIPKYLDPDVVQVVLGAAEETTKLLELQWDHSGHKVGRIVAAAAAKHLTPHTLEVTRRGVGKSPIIIDPKSDIRLAARRTWWGKLVNAGQICITPDYVLVPREVQDMFIKEIKLAHAEFFPEGPKKSDSFGRIVTLHHTQRIAGLLKETKGDVIIGGEVDIDKRYIAPTLVNNASPDEPLMKEEIFGPVLPVIPVKDVDEAIAFVNARDHPLALYVFSQDAKVKAKIADNTQSGAYAVNEPVSHVATYGLPFGGTGPSGSGQLRGKYGFDTFTHLRGSVDQPGWYEYLNSDWESDD
ncbi:NAD-dependent aldehyde dehydrogenase [Cristinia sonorae]|uniref:Aldehyde dehydrogenase n=1 Tax=Cristinia sonorae TaxID=1940300 RepID=A0A8K0XKM5_9AGAR|nr:NAD-dependent aldehyde dehydrogenase [Cristinia sonorae]